MELGPSRKGEVLESSFTSLKFLMKLAL
ncbi:unnamed protein product [Larinioides sclopetarius]|uniref:Uncharacterized protein n=1 Tax=Larinioides sclopetarius TaxID=280406 RepID=A0AAV2BBB6_9ARAC